MHIERDTKTRMDDVVAIRRLSSLALAKTR